MKLLLGKCRVQERLHGQWGGGGRLLFVFAALMVRFAPLIGRGVEVYVMQGVCS